MKKTTCFLSLISCLFITACSSTYYAGNVKYIQDGDDCVYYARERGRKMSRDIYRARDEQKIIYRDTLCRDLYADDSGRMPERNVVVDEIEKTAPVVAAAVPVCPMAGLKPITPTCGFNKCKNVARKFPVARRSYYVVTM